MNGREEHELKVSQEIDKMIEGYPDYLKMFNLALDGEGKTYNTRKSYVHSVVKYLNYLKDNGKDINDVSIFKSITTIDIEIYFASIRREKTKDGFKETSGSYINMQEQALRSFFRFLIGINAIDKNPWKIDNEPIKIKKKKDEPVKVALAPEEINSMYNNISNGVGNNIAKSRQMDWQDRDLAIIDLALHTGLRVSALTEINIEDIDFNSLKINVIEKGNKSRSVKIDSESADLLRTWIAKRNLILHKRGKNPDNIHALFISNRCVRISQDAVGDIVKKYAKGINKKVTPHKMRSTFATGVYLETGDIYATSGALGHGNVEVTKRYVEQNENDEDKAINAMRQYCGR